jgi:hypothetical protein
MLASPVLAIAPKAKRKKYKKGRKKKLGFCFHATFDVAPSKRPSRRWAMTGFGQ